MFGGILPDLFRDGITLAGIGVLLSGCGAFLSGYAAFRLRQQKKEKNCNQEKEEEK